MSFDNAATPQDLPPHHGTEDTPHVHRCGCGETWVCSRRDCYIGDECTRCEDEAMTMWAESEGLTSYQPPLEPETALEGDG